MWAAWLMAAAMKLPQDKDWASVGRADANHEPGGSIVPTARLVQVCNPKNTSCDCQTQSSTNQKNRNCNVHWSQLPWLLHKSTIGSSCT